MLVKKLYPGLKLEDLRTIDKWVKADSSAIETLKKKVAD